MAAYLHRWSVIISYTLNCMPVSFISLQVYGMILTSFLCFSIHFSSNLYRKGKYILRERQKLDAWASLPGRASSWHGKMSEVTHKIPWRYCVGSGGGMCVTHFPFLHYYWARRCRFPRQETCGLWLHKKDTKCPLQQNGEKSPAKLTALNQTSLVLSSEQFPVTSKDAMFLGRWLWVTAQDQCCAIRK